MGTMPYSIVLGTLHCSRDLPQAESKSQEFFKEDPGLGSTIFKALLSKQKCFTVKVAHLPIDPQNFSTSNNL